MYFRFEPYYRPMLWGSESWILSAYPDQESVVTNGLYAGKTLSQLVEALGPALMGSEAYERYEHQFPLLIKFIDAQLPLSVQVHPSDEIAQRRGKGKVGKTEMWYALAGDKNANLYLGLKNRLTPETYAEHVANHTIVDDLMCYHPKEGDSFFITPGRIHSIGAGCRLLEIQQSSDLTYRIYDYDRRDASGKPRELHTALAAEAIDFTVLPDYETHYERKDNAAMPLVECDYFRTAAYRVTDKVVIDWSEHDCFLALIVTAGCGGRLVIDGEPVDVKAGDILLLPATTDRIEASGTFTFVTVTL